MSDVLFCVESLYFRESLTGQALQFDVFNDRYLHKVKAAVLYSMEIYYKLIKEQSSLTTAEYQSLTNFSNLVISAISVTEISNIIDQYNADIINRYLE